VAGGAVLKRLLANRWGRVGVLAAAVAVVPAWLVLTQPPDEGELAPLDFTLKDMNGNAVNLADFRGRPLIVNFWATWCTPCKYEIPTFVELVDKYADQGFTVLGVSVDDAPEDLRPFAAEYKINYPVLIGLGHDELQELYGANVLVPVSWFVRPDGRVHLKSTGIHSKGWFEEQVKALLAD
jgi:peroxiredoxin